MSIQVTCSCGKKLSVKEEFAGKQGKCPGCGAGLLIPGTRQLVEKASPGGKRCPSCQVELAKNAVLCVNCGLNLKTGKKMKAAASEDEPAPVAPVEAEVKPELKKPGMLPGWCRAALIFDIVWSWVVVGIVIGLFIYYNRGSSTAEIKEWGIVGFFVALLATIANLRLMLGKPSGVWLGYLTLAVTLLEQWMRMDENWSNKGVVAVIAICSLLYDAGYLFAIYTAGKVQWK